MIRLASILLRMLMAGFCVAIVFAVWAWYHPLQFLTIDDGPVQADEMVVLGGGDGRAERAAELFRQGAAPRVLVSGHGDCAVNVKLLVAGGVPAKDIETDPSSLTTLENAQFSAKILRVHGVHRVIIVTSWFHSRRALATFEHVAPEIRFYSRPSYIDFDPKKRNPDSYRDHVKVEYEKLVGYWIAHGIWPL